jgi:aromatic-L-amino-acid decarboxylase
MHHMDSQEFRKYAHQFVDWMADYLEEVENYPVKSQVQAGEIMAQLPVSAPRQGQEMEEIFADFQRIILPGITHWQSPNFFAYFPGNGSYPSVLAEMLTATLGAQCMIWETSPAAAELEERVLDWLRQMIGLPDGFAGVIQSTASDATLCALLSAREAYSDYQINQAGFKETGYRVYASEQTHSSIEKAVKIAGFGKANYVPIPADEKYALQPRALREAIEADLAAGLRPLCVVATLGTTSSTAIDPLPEIAAICEEFDLWLHVDAAFAGSALILPEFQHWIEGKERIDSFVFNPHKWLFTNFDCSAYYVRSTEKLVRTFEIMPEYLKTKNDAQVNNYRDWGIPLGRRFRALKLWFVLRNFGQEGLQNKLRQHIRMIQGLASQMEAHPQFEVLAPVPLNLVCFRWVPEDGLREEELDRYNERLLHQLNASGKVYLTHTRLQGRYTLRLVGGQTQLSQRHLDQAWALIQATAQRLAPCRK